MRNWPRGVCWKLGLVLVTCAVLNGPSPVRGGEPAPVFPLNQDWTMKTLGGKQFWGDVAFFHGWRIQQWVVNKKYRLLDPNDYQHAYGTLEDCQKKLKEVKQEKKLPKMSGTAVVLIHGIIRSSKSFNKMAKDLKSQGYTVVGFDYPSTRIEIDQSADYLHQLLQSLEGIEKIHLVVHSMGGLLVRCYLQQHQDARIGRMVMLGVPNLGANMADVFQRNLLFKMIFGPAGPQLGLNRGFIKALPTPAFEFAVIAGARGKPAGFNPLVPGDDDGTISVDCTRLPGAADFATVRCLHSLIMNNADAIEYTRNYLKTGQLRKAGEKQPIPKPAGQEPRDKGQEPEKAPAQP